MACGCSSKPDASYTFPRALMCHGCFSNDGTRCAATGEFVSVHIQGLPCPASKFPDSRGVTLWAFLEWVGVPKPLRWYARWTWGKLDYSKLDGCGCVKWLRDGWDATARTWKQIQKG